MLPLLLACAMADKPDSGAPTDTAADTAVDTAAETGGETSGETGLDSGETSETGGETGETGGETGDTACATYADGDGDGFGDPATPSCEAGAVADATDCDDADPHRFPGAPELCDGLPNDCADWTAADEDGLVTAWPTAAAPVDATPAWAAGTPDAPAALALTDPAYTICPGTWYIRLSAAGPLSLVGPHGSAATRLDARGARVLVAADDLVASGLTVMGGNAAGEDGGAFLHLAGLLELTDLAFVGNAGSLGGALAVLHDAHDASPVTLTDVALDANRGDVGGGVYVEAPAGAVSIVGLTATGNEATEAGGAVSVAAAQSVALERCDLAGNSAGTSGGGLLADASATVTLGSVVLATNDAAAEGGGAWLAGAEVLLTDLTLADNSAGATGGGLAAWADHLAASDVAATGNAAGEDGGGLYAAAESLDLATLTATGNAAGGYGGGMALLIGTRATLTDASLGQNGAVAGGGAWLQGDALRGITAELATTDVWENTADDAAGLLLDLPRTALSGVTLRANRTPGDGGGAWVSGDLTTADGTTFEDGEAARGGGVWIESGTLSCSGSPHTADGLRRNAASSGGAVAIAEAGAFTASSCDLGDGADDNVATDLGADVFLVGPETAWAWGDDATFTCDGASCS